MNNSKTIAHFEAQEERNFKKIVFFKYFTFLPSSISNFSEFKKIREKLKFLFYLEFISYKIKIILEDPNLPPELTILLENYLATIQENNFSFIYSKRKTGRHWYKGLNESFNSILPQKKLDGFIENYNTPKYKELITYSNQLTSYYYPFCINHSRLEPYSNQLKGLSKRDELIRLKAILIEELSAFCLTPKHIKYFNYLIFLNSYYVFSQELFHLIKESDLSIITREKTNHFLNILNKDSIISSRSSLFPELQSFGNKLFRELITEDKRSNTQQQKLFELFKILLEQAKYDQPDT